MENTLDTSSNFFSSSLSTFPDSYINQNKNKNYVICTHHFGSIPIRNNKRRSCAIETKYFKPYSIQRGRRGREINTSSGQLFTQKRLVHNFFTAFLCKNKLCKGKRIFKISGKVFVKSSKK